VVHRSIVPGRKPDTVTEFLTLFAVIGKTQIVDFPVLLVFEKECFAKPSFGMDLRLSAHSVGVDHDRGVLLTGTAWFQASDIASAATEQEDISRPEDRLIDTPQGLPGS